MKRAFSTLCCLTYNIEEIFQLEQGDSMDGVELRLDMERIRAWMWLQGLEPERFGYLPGRIANVFPMW